MHRHPSIETAIPTATVDRRRSGVTVFGTAIAASIAAVAASDIAAASNRLTDVNLLLVGRDGVPGIAWPIIDDLEAACINVTTVPQLADFDPSDIEGMDVVYLVNGVTPGNPSGPGDAIVPSPDATDALVAFLQGGGGLFVAGENDNWGNEILDWRDALQNDVLGAGPVDSQCLCNLGMTVTPVAEHPTATYPNAVGTIAIPTVFTGGFVQYGTGTPIAFGSSSTIPVAVAWPEGSMKNAPAGRLVAFNNMNNAEVPFGAWSVNAAAYLADVYNDCPADRDMDGDVDFDDLLALLAAWGTPDECEAAGPIGFDQLLETLSAFGPCP